MTSVYTAPRLYRQISCGTNSFLTVKQNIILFGYNDTKQSVPFQNAIAEFDCTFESLTQKSVCPVYSRTHATPMYL
jgi:hypothetical protein